MPNVGRRQEGEGHAHRRRLPRGPDLRPVGQGAGPEILVADQGQAGLLRSAPGGRERCSTRARHWFEENPAEARRSSPRSSRPRGPRGGPQGARADPAQGRAGHRVPARQAGRLPGARSGEVRDCSSSRATPPAARPSRAATGDPGRPAAARQDPQRRARALRPDAVVEEIGTLITALGTGIGATSSTSTSCATTRSSS